MNNSAFWCTSLRLHLAEGVRTQRLWFVALSDGYYYKKTAMLHLWCSGLFYLLQRRSKVHFSFQGVYQILLEGGGG